MSTISHTDVYVAIISDSRCDRTDIIYIGTDRNKATDLLWENYNEYYADNSPENGKYSKSCFIKAAEADNNSAYIQLFDSHINFELHKRPMDNAKQS